MTPSESTIPVRKLTLDLAKPPRRHWCGGRPFESQWFNALSQGLPKAERYAIECVKKVLPKVADAKLVAQARGFIGQEAAHSFLHNSANAELERQGLSFILEGYTDWRISKGHWLHELSGMAITVSWEHFTGILCEHTLTQTDLQQTADEPFRALWVWHCAEELEHQCLTHDIYTAAGGGYLRKVFWYLYGTGLFFTDFAIQTLYNLYRDGSLFSPRTWLGGLRYFFGRKGIFWFALPRWLSFFRPSFHPSRYNDEALVERTLAGLEGQLRVVATHSAS